MANPYMTLEAKDSPLSEGPYSSSSGKCLVYDAATDTFDSSTCGSAYGICKARNPSLLKLAVM